MHRSPPSIPRKLFSCVSIPGTRTRGKAPHQHVVLFNIPGLAMPVRAHVSRRSFLPLLTVVLAAEQVDDVGKPLPAAVLGDAIVLEKRFDTLVLRAILKHKLDYRSESPQSRVVPHFFLAAGESANNHL